MKKRFALMITPMIIGLCTAIESFVEASEQLVMQSNVALYSTHIEPVPEFSRVGNSRIITYFGSGNRGFADADSTTTRFTLPQGIIANDNGIIVFDTYNNLIREVRDGQSTTMAGSILDLDETRFPQGKHLDGDLEIALLNRPTSGVLNSRGELIFADSANNTIRRITDGNITTIGGTSVRLFNNPMSIAIDDNDNIYVADTLNSSIRIIYADGRVRVFAGRPGVEGFADGDISNALFREPSGIAVSGDGSVVYVSDTGNHKIRKIENGVVTTIAGTIEQFDEDGFPIGSFRDGDSDSAMFNLPMGITIAGDALIVADRGNNMVRLIDAYGNVSTLAGNRESGDVDGIPSQSMLSGPSDVYFSNGVLYIADTNNNKIKMMSFDSEVLETYTTLIK